jgi:hypothetical protein
MKYPGVVSEKFTENRKSYYLCKCSVCGIVRRVRAEYVEKIKSCPKCHHKAQRPPQPSEDYHWCNKCKSWKMKIDFNFRKDGKSRNCKKCEDQYRRANMQKINEYAKNHKKKNIEKSLLYSARSRARQNGLQINICFEDIIIPEYCPVLGIKISIGGNKDNSPSLDKILPHLRYVKENVRVISWRANWLKNNSTAKEIEKLYLDSLTWRDKI